ncbi:hypothetical protein FSP39_006710 [Pinctada imbricata]|uniref:G-protein coupled receptors family 1 profile domain-containing protein n=1 Tax=Pinctada imbricata TaxID=66713 RepID=A0AA88XLG8_PINIB|nr:hypothetical protein FSP39_006710 [Pinctada imbricata]
MNLSTLEILDFQNLSQKSEAEALVSDTLYNTTQYIWTIVSPILILVGTVSNVLSIIVLTRKRLIRNNTMFYLAVLSVTNICALYVGLLRYWMRYAFGFDIRTHSSVTCPAFTFLVYFLSDFINWTLVAVAVDRCIYVCLPLKAAIICSRKRAILALFFIFVMLVFFNIHLFWGVHIAIELDSINCSGANYFTNYIWSVLDLIVRCLIPFIVMIVTNFLIISNIRKSRSRVVQVRHSSINTERRKREEARISGLNRTLHSISLMFLLLATPSAIYEIYLPYFGSREDGGFYSVGIMELLRAIVNLLLYSNNVLHFFVYLLSNTQFRRELRRLCRRTFTREERIQGIESQSSL